NFDQKSPTDVRKILTLAAADNTPDKVRDLAFRRVGEMPRDKVIAKLYEMFGHRRWQVRWVAAQYAIKMSDTTQIPEIMAHLPKGRADNFAMTEALTYGDWMGDPSRMAEKGGQTGRQQLVPYLRDANIAAKTSAAGWFFGHGTQADVPMLSELTSDRAALPKCSSDQTECEWRCYVDKQGGKKDEKEAKDPASFGEFVRYCIIPNIKDRKVDPARDKREEKKGDQQ
ncbi:MAG: hypothetical protein MUF54_00665, partial [Polyangiaceae bacterium]|nr:hypothetical protein [Polyangiaceae bacterium]